MATRITDDGFLPRRIIDVEVAETFEHLPAGLILTSPSSIVSMNALPFERRILTILPVYIPSSIEVYPLLFARGTHLW